MLKKHSPDKQDDLFRSRLDQIINMKHQLVILSKIIDWDSFDGDFANCYCDDNGRTAKPIRLKIGLTILQSIYNLSDEAVVEDWIRDPYFQYFCGEEFFCHDSPVDPTGLTRFRQKIGEEGMNKILQETIRIGSDLKLIRNKKDLTEITIDSTTQEKNITYPTDSRLYNKARKAVVKLANDNNINLRQNYNILAKKALFLRGLYQRQRKNKLAKKQDRKLQTYLRRVIADYERKANEEQLQESQSIINRAKVALNQKINDKNKIYSWHEDNIMCFSKGKMYKKYEFGSKTTIAATNKSNFILSIITEGKNRHDSKILSESIQKTQNNINQEIQKAFLDKGYRGNNYPTKEKLFISGQKKLSITPTIRKKIKRRNAIEQINSVLKNYHRLNKSYLKGEVGDQINANMAGLGYNFKRILQQIAKILCVQIFYQIICLRIRKITQKVRRLLEFVGYDLIILRNSRCSFV
jgi:transposase, IS5 family